MKNKPSLYIVTVGLAVFSMFFGAGNLIYPLMVGLESGCYTGIGMAGFLLTSTCLPLMGLIAMILFDGNYELFFERLGKNVGRFMIFLCMLVIGPGLAIPRIVTLSHTMVAPFIPVSFLQVINPFSSFVFALIFLGITLLATYRENRIVALLGNVISPALLISLAVIIIKGIWTAQTPLACNISPLQAFTKSFVRGYETLDLLGAIFFSSIVIHILKNTIGGMVGYNRNRFIMIGLKAGALGVSLLAMVYIGMGILTMYHGHNLQPSGDLFRVLAFNVLGIHGSFIIATAVLLACLSTSIALSAVVGEYFHIFLFDKKIGYAPSLIMLLLLSIPLSTFGLDYVLELTGGPITYIGYPVLIMLTFCNLGHKLFNFHWVKLPVAATFILALFSYLVS
jgi:LIVCS family branched-chain amino acid:cation transporter